MSNYTDNLTLDEIAANDLEMAKDAIKNAKKYSFGSNKKKASLFIKHCLDNTLKLCGINVTIPKNKFAQKRYEKILAEQMEKAGVEIEGRRNYKGNDTWRNGIYVTKNGELVAFISSVLGNVREEYSRSTMKLSRRSIGFFVVTNARTDTIKRVYGGNSTKPVEMIAPPNKTKSGIISLH